MEVENSRNSCKRPRQAKPGSGDRDDEDDEADAGAASRNEAAADVDSSRLLRPWHHPASRIFRVSRASGGKDRHSKVYTSKGLRDRRVRLSVSTAIQFYDLQDRLGYDQPSKAIEWLIKAAASAIAELPSLDSNFPANPDLAAKHELASAAADPSYNQHSSASETSKGSVLSLSRSEIRVKARERARERAAKDKDSVTQNLNHGFNSQSSFTELLTGGTPAASTTTVGGAQKHTTADYFGTETGLFGHHHHHQQQQKSTTTATTASYQINPSAFASHFGNSSSPIGMLQFSNAGEHHPAEMQQFAFLQQDHFFPVPASASAGGGDNYNLNFSISPGLAAGFHRGTLQSNSPSQHHHHQQPQQLPVQRLSSPLGGPGAIPFLFGAAATAASDSQYSAGFDGQLYKHLELQGKGKN